MLTATEIITRPTSGTAQMETYLDFWTGKFKYFKACLLNVPFFYNRFNIGIYKKNKLFKYCDIYLIITWLLLHMFNEII